MSLYDDASLIMYPSGYKEDKIYSLKPTDGSGDLTFTRASTATRVNSDGLIEKVRTNLILQSNTFDTTWGNSSTTETSGQSGYDGTSNAWLLSKSAASGYIVQFVSVSGVQTFSVYAKANASTWSLLQCIGGSNPYAYFNLDTGVVGTIGGGAILSSIEDVGGDWYRISMIYDTTISFARIYPAESNTASATSGSIYIQDAQLETGDIATEYIPTTTTAVSVGMLANVPRIDYTSGCGKLLLEPQRTNSLFYSEQFDNAAWTKGAVSVTANNAVSPDGYTNADLITADGTTTQHYVFQFQSAAARTYSIFLKMGTQRYVQILTSGATTLPVANYDLQNGVANMVGSSSTASIENYGNGGYRCILSTTDAAAASFYLLFASSMTSVRYEVNNSSGTIWAYGAQAELGSYATSYIPTTSTTVTRTQDSASKSGISSLINSEEGVLYAEISALADDLTYRILSISDGTTAERIYIQYTNVTNTVAVVIKNGSTTQANMGYALSDETELAKVAIKYKANDFALWVNGFEVGTDASGTTPTGLSELAFDDGGGANHFYGNVQSLMIFPSALSDTELATLTTL